MKNNPINFNDPSGHKPCPEEFGCEGKLPKPKKSPIPPPDEDTHHGRHDDDIIDIEIPASQPQYGVPGGLIGPPEDSCTTAQGCYQATTDVSQYVPPPPLSDFLDWSAFGFGLGGTAGATPGSFAGGADGMYFFDENETGLFYYGGTTFLAGGEATAGPYAVFGYNMYDNNDYSGVSNSVNVTFAYGHGITVGYFWSGEEILTAGAPQGFVIGYTPGYALSLSYSEPEYHPLLIGEGY